MWYTLYSFCLIRFFPLLEYKLHEPRNYCLICSLLYLEQYLAHMKALKNIWWMNKTDERVSGWMNEWTGVVAGSVRLEGRKTEVGKVRLWKAFHTAQGAGAPSSETWGTGSLWGLLFQPVHISRKPDSSLLGPPTSPSPWIVQESLGILCPSPVRGESTGQPLQSPLSWLLGHPRAWEGLAQFSQVLELRWDHWPRLPFPLTRAIWISQRESSNLKSLDFFPEDPLVLWQIPPTPA